MNDTQKPSITCPTKVTAVALATCPVATTTVVNFTPPAVSDNCAGATLACSPPSGAAFSVGTTTVTCTATDAAGNTSSCSFPVTVFNGCLQDDANPGSVVLFNTLTGAYRFCCNGVVIKEGVGTVTQQGCCFTIQHNPADSRVLIKTNFGNLNGTASIQSSPGAIRCSIADKNMLNNGCQCTASFINTP